MRGRFIYQAALAALLICQFSICLATESSDPNNNSKYLDAVRTFADNVLKYGRDTYGPKHTPLFVDGLSIHTHEPVKWISPKGERWVLSNLASQQNLFRTLDGLTKITGDPKYRQAAMETIEYAFKNLRHPNGLFYWGHTTAYNAGADDVIFGSTISGGGTHALKLDYPYYELMWEVNPKETKKSIEAFWSAHVIDWSNLDFDRYALFNDALEEPWNHEYKRYPTFFKSKKFDSAAGTWTGTSLIHAGTTLYRLSSEEQPSVWSKRLAERFIDARHPKTGISYESYTYRFHHLGDDLREHFNNPYTRHFPQESFDINMYYYFGENVTTYAWMSMLLVGEMLGEEGKDFKRWALEEFTAMGKTSYRKKDNAFVPILTDGTSLEGYVYKKAPGTGSEGLVVKPLPADMPFFWSYSVAYRVTGDDFMWQMVRDIARGNNFGDIGQNSADIPELKTETSCSDVYGLLGFLQLYEKTTKPGYLNMARRIGDNILLNQFHKGFFVLSKKHIYTRFDCLEPLGLLHLDAATKHKKRSMPRVWPSVPLFVPPYRHKKQGIDRLLIYTLTESSEPPLSLQEAATIGDVNLVRTLIKHRTDIDSLDNSFLYTALHCAAMSGHKNVVELLLAKGADIEAGKFHIGTALHFAVEKGHKEIVELLIDKGADVNANNTRGQTPIDVVGTRNRKEIVELLTKHGATISSIHTASVVGDLARVRAFLENGIDINVKDNQGNTPLHLAAQGGHREVVEFLLSKDSDVNTKRTGYPAGDTPLHTAARAGNIDIVELLLRNGADTDVKNESGQTPLDIALSRNRKDIIELLISKGADVSSVHLAAYIGDLAKVKAFIQEGIDINTKVRQRTPLHYAAREGRKEIVELLLENGADTDVKNESGQTPLDIALSRNRKDIIELLISKGADVSSVHLAAYIGDLAKVKAFIQEGIDINTKVRQRTPLHYAAREGHMEIVELLLENGADVNAGAYLNRTAAEFAMQGNHNEIVELLVSKGADIPPLHLAIYLKNVAKARSLIEGGADVNKRTPYGTTPLDRAVGAGLKNIVELLIAKNADVNAKDNWNWTPLHSAVYSSTDIVELKDMVKLLIARGSNVNAKDGAGRTPLWYAEKEGHTEIVELLKKHAVVIKVSSEPKHDVAITGVSALSRGPQDYTVPVVVNIENQGNFGESFEVTLTDTTSDEEIGTKSVHLSLAGVDGMDEVCDLIFNSPVSGTNIFGNRMSGHGDGYDDLLITAPEWNKMTGRTYLYYGGVNMDAIPDKIFDGEHAGDYLCGCALGDVNNDNYSDVILGAKGYNNYRGRIYIYLGGPDGDQNADLILEGELEQGGFGQLIDTGDVDNDGYEDVLVTAPRAHSMKGRAYLYYGGDPMDMNYDGIFEGENAGDYFGRICLIGEDVDGDNYKEILIGARWFPGHNPEQGRAYLYYGNDKANMDTTCDVVFTCPEFGRKNFGCSIGLFDVDTDGYAEVIIGARFAYNYRGRVYLYWGDKRTNMDAIPDKIFTGEKDGSPNLGGDTLYCGYFNKDNYGDIAIGAYNWNHLTGRVYVYYGGKKTLMDIIPDKIFTGVLGSAFGCEVSGGDFNNDGYSDIVAGGWNYNNREGRAWLYYGSPGDSTQLKFNWNTNNVPPGKHTLKVEIPPIPGEKDISNNTMTVTVEIKEPSK